MLRVIIVGYGELASSLMLGTIESSHKVVGVLTWKNKNRGIKSIISSALLKLFPDNYTSLMKTYGIYEINAKSINSFEFIKEAVKLQADVILVGAWGEILKKETIIVPKIACINCHPSLLPAHRGANPYSSVLRQGETKTGITFHLMDEKIDTGPILLQKEIEILKDDNGDTLRKKCAYKARQTVQELLDELENGMFIPVKQNEKKASYFPRLKDSDAKIDWNKPAEVIHNQIRGLYPWMECYTRHNNQFIMVNSSKIVELENLVNEPGKILAKSKKTLNVSTADPYKAVLLENVRVYGFLGNLWTKFYLDRFVKINDSLKKV